MRDIMTTQVSAALGIVQPEGDYWDRAATHPPQWAQETPSVPPSGQQDVKSGVRRSEHNGYGTQASQGLADDLLSLFHHRRNLEQEGRPDPRASFRSDLYETPIRPQQQVKAGSWTCCHDGGSISAHSLTETCGTCGHHRCVCCFVYAAPEEEYYQGSR